MEVVNGREKADSAEIEAGSNDVTLSLSLSWNSHGNCVSTSTHSASHPPSPSPRPPTHTPPGAFSCCGDGGSPGKWKEGGEKCVRETSSSLVDTTMSRCLTDTETACIHLRFMSRREHRSRERPSLSSIQLLKCPYVTVKNAVSKGHPSNWQQPRSH